nr:MAG TPA: hypothetical protein [Caudoviricetes sp.]
MNRQYVHTINQRLITPIDFDVVNYMGFKAAIFSDLFGIDPYNIGDRDAYIHLVTTTLYQPKSLMLKKSY